jgi:hypothetical protein
VFPRNNKADDVWQTVFDIKGSYREMKPSSYKLTPKEQQQLNKLMATTRVGGKTLGQRIREFRGRPDVANYLANRGAAMQGVKYQIEKDMDKMIREHFTLAEQRLASDSNDLMNRIRVSEARALAAGSNDVQSVQQLGTQLDELYQRARRGY